VTTLSPPDVRLSLSFVVFYFETCFLMFWFLKKKKFMFLKVIFWLNIRLCPILTATWSIGNRLCKIITRCVHLVLLWTVDAMMPTFHMLLTNISMCYKCLQHSRRSQKKKKKKIERLIVIFLLRHNHCSTYLLRVVHEGPKP
jgi:hypothetical protein